MKKKQLLFITFFTMFAAFHSYSNKPEKNKAIASSEKNENGTRSYRMELDELKNKIKLADGDAVIIADRISDKEGVISVIRSFLSDSNPEVRLVAVDCLSDILHPESIKLMANMLSDSYERVRTSAMQTLYSHHNSSIVPQLIENLNNPDQNIAASVAMIIGYVDDASALPALKKQIDDEERATVKRNLVLASARLGDTDAQKIIAEQIKNPDSAIKLKIIDDLRYINDARIAPYLYYAMDDYGKGKNIGSKNKPFYARVLDAAITLAIKLMGDPFSFSVKEYELYTDEEITEARTKLGELIK